MVATNQSIVLDARNSKSIGNVAIKANHSFIQAKEISFMGVQSWASKDAVINVYAKSITFHTANPSDQVGIYARFA